ncbi:MAG: tRNA 2-thiouridine(34) synthase MnmA [Nanoarchaeota archaeon]|nr:tRNA 2-thiouridine(34) synthase MnmA [Nanoarchaeota archaeon]
MKNSKKTVLLALSGGVDSAVAAMLLKKQGYRIIAAFMKNFSDTKDPLTNQCSWKTERNMAIKIAYALEIPFITLDFEKEYKKQVIEPMFKAYKKGQTPNPDILCNSIIKFPLLWKAAKKLKADYLATGHYARIKKTSKGYHLLSAKDSTKDQSYFLADVTQDDLSHTLFPIGNYTKKEIRNIARKNKFLNWDKTSTRGVCFIGDVNFNKFLREKIKEKPGKVINPEGSLLGTHKGIPFYTIGQKALPSQGIMINKPSGFEQKRFYVAGKRKNNILVVAPENHPSLKRKQILIRKIHLINKKIRMPKRLKARIRHLGILHSGNLKKITKGWMFTFDKPLEALAEGQYIVFYKNQEVIGCGEMKLK